MRNLVKASNLSVSKLRLLLLSKRFFAKFTFATRKLKRKKSFARFKNEVWCMYLAYVDKIAKDDTGAKYLLVRQDLFDRVVDAKAMKTKDSETSIFDYDYKIESTQENLGRQEVKNCWESLKNYAKLKEDKFTQQ